MEQTPILCGRSLADLVSRFIRPDEGRLPLPYKPVDRAESPSGGYSDAPPCATAPPIPTLPIQTPALDCASSGSTSVRVDGGPGLPWRSSPAYSALPVIVGVTHFLAYVSPSSVPPSLRKSVFYPIASPLALFLAAANRFFFDCALYVHSYVSSPRPWMHLHGRRFPLL